MQKLRAAERKDEAIDNQVLQKAFAQEAGSWFIAQNPGNSGEDAGIIFGQDSGLSERGWWYG
jgi:hypothetical protein